MAIKGCTICDEGQSTFKYIIYQFPQYNKLKQDT